MTGAARMDGWLDRVVNARGEISQRPWRRLAVAGMCAAVLVGTGVADVYSGRDLSLGVVYLIPVMVATVLLGRTAGVTLTAMGLVVWLTADLVPPGGRSRELIEAVNDLLRLVIFMLVVSLLSALISSLLSTRAANERGRRFLADAAHQLRTPLSGMSSASQALLLEPEQHEREVLLGIISRESIRAGRLVSSLLRMARLDQGETTQLHDTDVRRLLDEAAARWKSRWPRLQLTVDAPMGVPERAHLAQDACREIVDNLLDNACRHATNRVSLTVTPHQQTLELRVKDDGAGIPAGQEGRAFDRFVSLDRQGGSGLGLPIARQLARANGGDVEYNSHAFVVTIPWQPGNIVSPRLPVPRPEPALRS